MEDTVQIRVEVPGKGNFSSVLYKNIPFSWTVGKLKDHLCENHPDKPNKFVMKLVYAGWNLNDNKEELEFLKEWKFKGPAIFYLIDKDMAQRKLER